MDSLRREKLPEATLTKLNSLKNKEFEPRDKFSRVLEGILTNEELERWREPVLNHARKEYFEVASDAVIILDGKETRDGRRLTVADLPAEPAVRVIIVDGKAVKIDASSRTSVNWLSLVGLMGLFIAFGHSILAMSGEETLAQVYREVESPKLTNFKKAAFIVFVYSLALTAGISFLAVMLIPNSVRMGNYADNLIGGLAMYVWRRPGPHPGRSLC